MKPPSVHQLPSVPAYLVSELAALRLSLDLDHDDMAERMDAPVFEVVDFERNLGDPSISFLARYVRALDMRMEISLVPQAPPRTDEEAA